MVTPVEGAGCGVPLVLPAVVVSAEGAGCGVRLVLPQLKGLASSGVAVVSVWSCLEWSPQVKGPAVSLWFCLEWWPQLKGCSCVTDPTHENVQNYSVTILCQYICSGA